MRYPIRFYNGEEGIIVYNIPSEETWNCYAAIMGESAEKERRLHKR